MAQATSWTPPHRAALPFWRTLALTHWPAAVAVALTFALGVPTLIYPFGPDQALFAYMGDQIASGRALYVDVWDVKPPGIFWLYALFTRPAGTDPNVLRAADLLWTGATVAAIYGVGTTYWNRLAGASAAGLYGAVYVTATGYWHTAQPDSFAVLPFMLALLAWELAGRWGRPGLALLAGAGFGFCVQLRPVAVLFPLALVALDLLAPPVGARRWARPALRRALALAGGVLLVEAVTLLWLASGGAVGEYLYAQVEFAGNYGRLGGPYSPERLTLGGYLSGLRTGTMFIVFARLLLVAPALFALIAGGVVRRERHVAATGVLLAAAYVGVAVQGKFFLYHWHFVIALLALLSGWSAAFLWRELSAARSVRVSALTLAGVGGLLLLLTPAVTDRAAREWSGFARFYTQPESRSAYYDRFGLYARGAFSYRASQEVSAYVRARTQPGDTVFVWGYDPLIYIQAERESPSRFLSFLPLMSTWTPASWVDEFVGDLEASRPPYILVQRGENARWITGQTIDAIDFIPFIPRLDAYLRERYVVETRIEDYTILRRIGP